MLQGDSERTPSQTFTCADDESASAAVVRAVAAFTGRDPLSMEPLYRSVDPDALDALFESPSQGAGLVEFSFCGLRVQVTASGEGRLFEEA